jgi:hypothetical protein
LYAYLEEERELVFALLEKEQKAHFEAENNLALAEEAATFYKSGCERAQRILELQSRYMKYLEWAESEKTKRIEVLKKENQELFEQNVRAYRKAQQRMREYWNQYHTCWFHYLDLLHLCSNGKFMDTQQPINHTKLLRKSGLKFKHFL